MYAMYSNNYAKNCFCSLPVKKAVRVSETVKIMALYKINIYLIWRFKLRLSKLQFYRQKSLSLYDILQTIKIIKRPCRKYRLNCHRFVRRLTMLVVWGMS